MKPSSFNISAMPAFSCDAGTLTVFLYTRFALRTRVNMSAIGSVIVIASILRGARDNPSRPSPLLTEADFRNSKGRYPQLHRPVHTDLPTPTSSISQPQESSRGTPDCGNRFCKFRT